MRRRYAIKQLAIKAGRKATDMLALTQVNDPFYIGSKTQYIAGHWARELYILHTLWTRQRRLHIRRLHYFALTQPQHKKPNGQMYRNTNSDWKFLCDACKFARYLEILPYDAFVDRRSVPKSLMYSSYIGFDSFDQYNKLLTKMIERLCRTQVRFMLSKLMPVHIEVWVEKSTAADLIKPTADKYGINIVTTLGQISLTAVWEFIKRIKDCGKPVRIFYISDFDPAGESMPISVARKIEFLLRQYKLNRQINVKLRSLMLTRHQCVQFGLPGVPMPETKGRKFAFARYNGRCTTELHALEVFRRGYIRKVVERQLSNYVDIYKIAQAGRAAEAAVREVVTDIGKMIARDNKLTATMKMLEQLVSARWMELDYDGPWLLDSERDYLSQLASYHLHRLR